MANAAPRRTLFDALVDAAALYGRRTRIIEDLRRQVNTYGDLLKGSLALGRLTARFTAPGERVGVMLPNLCATVCLVFGLTSRGRVAAMLNYSSGVEALRVACVAGVLRTVITSRAFIQAAHLEHLLTALEGCRIVYLEDLRETMTLADKLMDHQGAAAAGRRAAAAGSRIAGHRAVHLGFRGAAQRGGHQSRHHARRNGAAARGDRFRAG